MKTFKKIISLIMVVAVWVASMIGYDKVIQLAKQIESITPAVKGNDEDNKQ